MSSMQELPFERSPRWGRRTRCVDIEVEVWARARPPTKGEQAVTRHRGRERSDCVRMYSDVHVGCVTIMNPLARNPADSYRSYCFDRCSWSSTTPSRTGATYTDQEAFYAPLEGPVRQVLNGFNLSVFAYGQANTGKTYTMFGRKGKSEEGIIPRAAASLLQAMVAYNGKHKVRYYKLQVGVISVYRNEAFDLLKEEVPASPGRKPGNVLPVHVTSHISMMTGTEEKQVHLPELQWHTLYSSDDIDHFLHMACTRRKPTSHCIVLFKVVKTFGASPYDVVESIDRTLEDAPERTSHSLLTMVDLAGTEDLRKHNPRAESTDAVAANKSLSVLRIAFERLAQGEDLAPPVRESVLTKVLVNSLGGNSRTLVITHVSPHAACYQESYNTLRFADTVKNVLSHVTFATPSPPCDDRVHEIRKVLSDPWLDPAQKAALEVLLADELDEVAQYDSWLQEVADRRRALISARRVQQQVVNKYNAITTKAGQEATTADAELQEAQNVMKRLMDRLAALESRPRGRYSAQLENEKQLLREQLQKATSEKLMLNNLKARLLRKLDNLTFEAVQQEAGVYSPAADPEVPGDMLLDNLDALATVERHTVTFDDPEEHVSDDSRADGVDMEIEPDFYEKRMAMSSVWLNTLEALSNQVGQVVDSNDIFKAKDLAASVREMGAAYPKFKGIMRAVGDRLESICSSTGNREVGSTVLVSGGRETGADAFDGTMEMNTAAVRVSELVGELALSEASAAKHLRYISMLESRVEELNNNCNKLVSSIREARKHELHPAAAASLAVGLAEVDYSAFSAAQADPSLGVTVAVRSLLEPDEYCDNITRVLAFKSAMNSVLVADTALTLLTPSARSQLTTLQSLIERVDITSNNFDGQLAVLRSEVIVQRKDAATMCDSTISLVPHETNRPLGRSQTLTKEISPDLAAATVKATEVAAAIRRDDHAEDKVREVHSMFLACSAPEAASLTDESRRRLVLGDTVGAAAALHAAAAAAAADMTIYSAPTKPSRLSALLNGLSELQKALTRGDLISQAAVADLRDQACTLSGLGPGAAECTASRLRTTCTKQDAVLVSGSAAGAARRHPGIGNFLRGIVACLQEDEPVQASEEAEKARAALHKTRLAAVEIDAMIKTLNVKTRPHVFGDIERAAEATSDAVTLLGGSPAGTLVATAHSGLQTTAAHMRNGETAKAVETARHASAAVTKAAITGVASAVQLARKFAAACAELRGKATATITAEATQQLAHDALILSQEAAYAAGASQPSAIVTEGLEQCTQKLVEAAEHLSLGKVCRDACEAAGKAGAAAWGAAEGHSNVCKAFKAMREASDHLASEDVDQAHQALSEAGQATQTAESAVTCDLTAARLRDLVKQINALHREPCGNTSAAEAFRIHKTLLTMAGEPGADETTARFIAERLNEVLRGLQGDSTNMELANVISSTIVQATESAELPTLEESVAESLKMKLEHALSTDGSNADKLIATAKHLAETQGGVFGKSMDLIATELAQGAPTQQALELCANTLTANQSLKSVYNTLQHPPAGGVTPSQLIIMSGELALTAAPLQGEAKQQLLDLSEKLVHASREPDMALEAVLNDVSTAVQGPPPEEAPGLLALSETLQLLASAHCDREREEVFKKLEHMKNLSPGCEQLFTAIDTFAMNGQEPMQGDENRAPHSMADMMVQEELLQASGDVVPESMTVHSDGGLLREGAQLHAVIAQLESLENKAQLQEISGDELVLLAEDLQRASPSNKELADMLTQASENEELTAATITRLKDEIVQAAGFSTPSDSTTRLANTLKNLASCKQDDTLDISAIKKAALQARAAAAKNKNLKNVAAKLDEYVERAERGDIVSTEELLALAKVVNDEDDGNDESDLEKLSVLIGTDDNDAILELLSEILNHRPELQGLLAAVREHVHRSLDPGLSPSRVDPLSELDFSNPAAVASLVERLRNGEELVEEAREAAGRLRSSSLKMMGLADEAEKCILSEDLQGLANVLEQAASVQSFSAEDLFVPTVQPTYTSLCAAIQELKKKYSKGIPVPEGCIADIQEKACLIGSIGPAPVESICLAMRQVPLNAGGVFAMKAASKRHATEEFMTAAGLLEDSNMEDAVSSCEDLTDAFSLSRQALANCLNALWSASRGCAEGINTAVHSVEAACSKLAVCGVDVNDMPAAVSALNSAAEAAETNPQEAASLVQNAIDVLGQHSHCATKKKLSTAIAISKALTELSKAMSSEYADRVVISEQLTFLRREAQVIQESSSSDCIISKSMARVIGDLSQLKLSSEEAPSQCVKIASRLRNSVDAQNAVAKGAELLTETVGMFLGGRTEEGIASIAQTAMLCECLKTYSEDLYEDLNEVASASSETPAMILAATVDGIAKQLSNLGGNRSKVEYSACVAVARLSELDDMPEESKAPQLEKLLDDMLLISGAPPSEGEAGVAALSEGLWNLERETDPLRSAEAGAVARDTAKTLTSCPGVVGDAMHEVVSMLDVNHPDAKVVADGVVTCTSKLRDLANSLSVAAAIGDISADQLSLLAGCALAAVGYAPGSSGKYGVELAERLGDAAGRKGRGLPVNLESLRDAAAEAAGLKTAKPLADMQTAELNTLTEQAKQLMLSGGVDLLDAVATLEDAATGGSVTGKTLAAVAKVASLSSHAVLEDLSSRIDAATEPFNFIAIASLLDDVSTQATESPKLRGLLSSCREHLKSLCSGKVSLLESLNHITAHPEMTDRLREELQQGSEKVSQLTTRFSDACAAVLQAEGNDGAKDALRLVLSTVDGQGSVETVMRAAEEALKESNIPYVASALQDLKDSYVSLAQVAAQGAKAVDIPSEARYALYDTALAALVCTDKVDVDDATLKLTGAEMCCVLKTKAATNALSDSDDLLQLLQGCEVSDVPALRDAERTIAGLETALSTLQAELQERLSKQETTQSDMQQLQSELSVAKNHLGVIEQQLQKAEEYGDEREGKIVSLEDACSLLEGQLQEVEQQGTTSNAQLQKLREELHQSEKNVKDKADEMQTLQRNIATMKQEFEERLEVDRNAMQEAADNPSTASDVRQTLQGAVDEGISALAKKTLLEIKENHALPAHLQEAVQQVLTHGGDPVSQCETLTALQGSGVSLSPAVTNMIDVKQSADIRGNGLGAVCSSMATLADRIRRGSNIRVDSVREVSEKLRVDGAASAAALVDEATRRLQAGDSVGAALVLQAAAENTAATSAHGVPMHPKLAGLLADLAELHHRLSSGEKVTKVEISRLRGRALEAAALGSSAAESCVRHLAKMASKSTGTELLLLSEISQQCIQRHPELTELLSEFSQTVVDSPLVAGALLSEAADVYEEIRLIAVQTGETARRLQLGETGSEVQAAASYAAGTVSAVLDNMRHSSDTLQAASSSIRGAVDKLSSGMPSAGDMWRGAQQAEAATGCGLRSAIVVARRSVTFCKDLSNKIQSNTIDSSCTAMSVDTLVAELQGAAQAVPARSIIAMALGDAAALLMENSSHTKSLDEVAILLTDVADAQENVERCLEKITHAAKLLDSCGGVGGGAADPPALQEAVIALNLAGDAAGAASGACDRTSLTGVSRTLGETADALRGVAARCKASVADSSQRTPSSADILVLNSQLSKIGGKIGGDEAASRLIAERLRGMLDALQKKGHLPAEASETLHSFPSPVDVVAAEKEITEVGPSAGEAAASALAAKLRDLEKSLANGATLQDNAEEMRSATRDALKGQSGTSIVAKAMQTVESLIYDAMEKQVPDAILASLQGARELCEGAASASCSARRVARSLWGLESCAAYGIQPSRKDLVTLSEEAFEGSNRLEDPHATQELRDVANSLQEIAETLNVDVPVLGRLRDTAAMAAGLPVRGAAGAVADLASRTLALSTRVTAGGTVDSAELTRLSEEAKAAATRHPDAAPSLTQLAEELHDAATKAHANDSDLALGASYDRCKRLEESFAGPPKQDASMQWPDAEGFLSDEESVQKLRATLGKQMQEEMTKLNNRWKKKLTESETVREELAAELGAMAEQLAETDVELEVANRRVDDLEKEVSLMQRDAMEGVEAIIADKDAAILLHADALDSAAKMKVEDDETIERLEMEVATEAHMARMLAVMNERSLENWRGAGDAFANRNESWSVEEARLCSQLEEASKACSALEGAVTRIEQDKERLRYEMGLVEQEIQAERVMHENEVQNLELRISQQNSEIEELESALAENDTADSMREGIETGLRSEVEKHKELCSELNTKIATAKTKIQELEEELKQNKYELKSNVSKLEEVGKKLEEATALQMETEESRKELQTTEETSRQTIASLRTELEMVAISTAPGNAMAELQKELAKVSAERTKAQQEHGRLENEAAEALETAAAEKIRLEHELKESQLLVAELSEALELED